MRRIKEEEMEIESLKIPVRKLSIFASILFIGYAIAFFVMTINGSNAIIFALLSFALSVLIFYYGGRRYVIHKDGIEAYLFNRCVKKYLWSDFHDIRCGGVKCDDIRCIGGRYEWRCVQFSYSNERWNEFIKYAPIGKISAPPSDEMIKSYTPVSPDWRMTEEEKAEAHAKEAEERTKNDQRK